MAGFWVAAGAAGGGVLGALAVAAEGVALNAMGFTAFGPAADSIAATWMSSIAGANGVGVPAGSLYAACQASAMRGGALLGASFVIGACATGAAVGIFAMHLMGGDEGGDGAGGDGGGEAAGGDGGGDAAGGDGDGEAAGGDDPATDDSTEPVLSEEEE